MNETLLNKARLNVVSLNKALINGAVERHGSSAGGGGAPSKYIRFADPAVEAVLMANGVSSDGVGITKEDAAAVTTIGIWFRLNTTIVSFNELEYFTGVTFLGASTTQASNGAFNGCTSLQSVTLPASVTHIRPGTFKNCTSLNGVGDMSKVEEIGFDGFYNATLAGALRLDNCVSIGWGAFYASQITELYIPKVQAIGAGSTNFNSRVLGAFANCKLLTKAFIGNTCTLINPYAFAGCSELAECDIPSSIVTLGKFAFHECAKLGGVINLPNLEMVGVTAFMGSGIEGIDNLGKITRLEYSNNAGVFMNCTKLQYATLPDTLTFLGRQTFQGCNALTRVDIGTGIAEIEYMAFQNCTSLQEIICRAVAPPTLGNANAFSNTNNCPIYVPDAALEVYKTATNWSQYQSRIKPLSEYVEA